MQLRFLGIEVGESWRGEEVPAQIYVIVCFDFRIGEL